MGAPRRISSRLSQRRISLVRNSQKAKLKEEKEQKEAQRRKRRPIDVRATVKIAYCAVGVVHSK